MGQRKAFPILDQKINDERFVYLDSAATALVSTTVQKKVIDFLNSDYSNIHRGVYTTSMKSSQIYEETRQTVKQFLDASEQQEVVYTSGTTESLNLVAYSFGDAFIKEHDEIFISPMEHHANLIPWQQLAKRKNAKLVYMPLNEDGVVDISAVQKMITTKTKLIAVTQVSNVTGVINDVDALAKIIHKNNGYIVVDGAQAVTHLKVNVSEFDFYTFSGHKIGALNGIGILCGNKNLLNKMQPIKYGGDMISIVQLYESNWNEVPYKFEGGTPNIVAVVSLKAAIEQLLQYSFDHFKVVTEQLMTKTWHTLQKNKNIELYGSLTFSKQSGIISFNFKTLHPHDVATALDLKGIAVRAGHHCAQVYMKQLEKHATLRLSTFIYTNEEDINIFLSAIEEIGEFFNNGII